MSMGTEVQTGSDTREGAALLQSKPAVWCSVFMFHLFQVYMGESVTISVFFLFFFLKANEKSCNVYVIQ